MDGVGGWGGENLTIVVKHDLLWLKDASLGSCSLKMVIWWGKTFKAQGYSMVHGRKRYSTSQPSTGKNDIVATVFL